MAATVGPGPLAPQLVAHIATTAAEHVMEAKKRRKQGEVPKALVRAVRAELRALLDGDLEDNLTQIEQVTAKARELFMSIRGPGAQFARGPQLISPQGMGGSTSTVTFGAGTSYSNPEQFGASAIRQLVSLVPEILGSQNNSPDKLMAAIVLAEEKGHHDVAESLKKKLLGGDAASELKRFEPHVHAEPVQANGAVNGGGSQSAVNGSAVVVTEAAT